MIGNVQLPKVVLLNRRPNESQFSIESYFKRLSQDFEELGLDSELVYAPVISKGIFNRLRILWNVWSLKTDLLHITGDITFSALTSRGPVVITIHDTQVLSRLSGLANWVVRWLWFELPIWRASAVTVNSNETARMLRERIRFAKNKTMHVIPVSVSDEFKFCDADFDASCPQILQIGTKANKNISRLARALEGISCRLLIIGVLTESQEKDLEKFGIDYACRSQLGQAELVDAFIASDMLAMVSTEEGFGMPIVEAQRVGRPVITSNTSSLPEVAGEGACLVDPFSVKSIREGVRMIMQNADYRDELVKRGHQNAKRFDRRQIAQQYVRVYETLRGDPQPDSRTVL